MIPAKPTTGAGGVNFRSRLEARWAQFLTLCEWPWAYEVDLDLHQWIPDFSITSGDGLLIEVKPAITMAGLIPHRERIEKSGTPEAVWLVGGALFLGVKDNTPSLGWLGMCLKDWVWAPAHLSVLKDIVQQRTPVDFKAAQRLMVSAGNELQWKKR